MTDTTRTNGNDELARRQDEYAKFLAKQTLDRDEAVAEAMRLKAEATGLKVTIDALEAQLANAQSKTKTAELIRDEAVARRAAVEAVLGSMMAIGRAFQIQNEPLVREIPEAESPTISGA